MADLLRILVGTSAQPNRTFNADGVSTDLDGGIGVMPTVVVKRPAGTTIAPGTISRTEVGTYAFTLQPQAECTYLTITWSGPVGSITQTLTSHVEVVGAQLFTIPEARNFKVAGSAPLNATADADLLETRDSITDEFEAICGWSFIPRYRRDTLYGALDQLVLDRLKVQRIISVTIDGTAFTAPSLADLTTPAVSGVIYRRTLGWFTSLSTSSTTVEYVHG